MHFLVLGLLLLAIIFGPGLWVRRVMEKYAQPDDRYQGNGAQLARLLLDRHGLGGVPVEETPKGDHYDPVEKVVRLSPGNFNGRSLTAITVAAHEVGHAVQDQTDYTPLKLRHQLVTLMGPVERVGAGILMVSPFIGMLTRAPGLGMVMFLGGLLSLGTAAIVHLVTLPTEIDASYGRALPMLEDADILIDGDKPHAERILRAAALTYVAASLASLLNVARWWAILRR